MFTLTLCPPQCLTLWPSSFVFNFSKMKFQVCMYTMKNELPPLKIEYMILSYKIFIYFYFYEEFYQIYIFLKYYKREQFIFVTQKW